MVFFRITNAFFWLFLSLWFGALLLSGVVAARTFPILKKLAVQVPGFESVDSAEHFKIAAGHVLYEVFFITDMIQFASVLVVTALIGVQIFSRKMPLLSLPNFVRLAALGVVLVTLGYHLFTLAPRMNANLREYWAAAQAGEDYAAYQQAFEADHPKARNVLTINVLGLGVVVLVSGFLLVPLRDEDAVVGGGSGDDDNAEPVQVSGVVELEEPALLNRPGVR